MSGSAKRSVFDRYAVAWIYLAAFCAAEVGYALLSRSSQDALLNSVSTSVHNLRHDAVGTMVASAFFTNGYLLAWPFLIALALFGANQVLGNWRTAAVCVVAHVIGTLVSEGIVAYRVAHGLLPPSDRFELDIGPSYVVVAAAAVALLHGSLLARAAAALDFVLLIFGSHVFAGLTRLDVAPVGHLTALVTGAILGTLLLLQRKHRKARTQLRHASATSVPMTTKPLLNWAR